MQFHNDIISDMPYQRNILANIAFDGKNFHGWQIQQNAVTVQEVFQNALMKILNEKIDIKGCSRTDSGVHANMYCISIKTSRDIPCQRLTMALNKFLPSQIVVKSCIDVPVDFHARYSCIGKEYIYKIHNSKIRNPFMDGYVFEYRYDLDEKLLNEAAQNFVGKHDFTSLCTLDKRKKENMVRNVKECSVKRQEDMVTFTVRADGFLYNMVRIMVGTLLRIAQNKIKPEDIPYILKAKNRKLAGPTAVACGLYLNKVFYDNLGVEFSE